MVSEAAYFGAQFAYDCMRHIKKGKYFDKKVKHNWVFTAFDNKRLRCSQCACWFRLKSSHKHGKIFEIRSLFLQLKFLLFIFVER